MSIFSLNWFKSRKQQEIDDLKHDIKVKELQRQLDRLDNAPTAPTTPTWQTPWDYKYMPTSQPTVTECSKPYKNIKLVNDVLTIVLNDGSIITKSGATDNDFIYARGASTEAQLLNLVASQEIVAERKKEEAEIARTQALRDGIQKLARLDDFELKGGSVYLAGIDRSLPQLLVEEFIVIASKCNFNSWILAGNEEFQSLKRFFMWCCLNPRAEVADKLYNFLKKNAFKITKQGFFAALRNVVTLHGSPELVQFVSNAYIKVKAVWKKSPDDYQVYLKDDAYSFIHIDDTFTTELVDCECYGDDDEEYWSDNDCDDCDENNQREETVKRSDLGECLGSLTELYLDLPNRTENRFTDAHTRTFDIRVGKAVSMDPKLCRWNTDDCGAEGLHFTSDEIHYVGCGDESVLVLINPMKVVGIGESKGRCWEYLPIMTVPRDEATSILHDLDFDTLQLDDSYAIRELEGLTEKAKDGFVAESKKHEFNMPHISTRDIENIVTSLETMKEDISKRIVALD